MFILGMDIGYSNLKIAFGEDSMERPETKILPAGAAPEEFLPFSFMNRKSDGFFVTVKNELFVAGIEPSLLEGWNRELHGDYPFTPTYRALFYTSLLLTGKKEIDLLVTGLPVNQFLDSSYRQKLMNSLKGVHRITRSGREVKVKNVAVIAQPMGSYLSAYLEEEEDKSLVEATTLVFDVGFFSVDWVVIDNQNVVKSSSGTSIFATSWLLEKVADLISHDYGSCPGLEKLESALRKDEGKIYVFSEKVNIYPYLQKVIKKYGANIAAELKRALRFQRFDTISNVVITGGGSEFYREVIEKITPRSRLIFVDDPVTANARGFWYYGLILKEELERSEKLKEKSENIGNAGDVEKGPGEETEAERDKEAGEAEEKAEKREEAGEMVSGYKV